MEEWDENKPRIFSIPLLHCTDPLIKAMKKLVGYEETRKSKDVIKLLRLIRSATHDSDGNKNPKVALVESDMDLYTSHQTPDQTCDEYHRLFDLKVEVINAHGGQAGSHPGLQQQVLTKILLEQGMTKAVFEYLDKRGDKAKMITKDSEERSRKEYLACLFVAKLDNIRFSELKKSLANDGLKGDVNYPTNIDAAYTLLEG